MKPDHKTIFQLLKSKRHAEAEQLLLNELHQAPQNTFLKCLLANSVLKQNRIVEAIGLADEVLQAENNPDALAIKGLALLQSQQLAEGSELLELSLSQRENLYYRAQLVQALLKQKLVSKCTHHLEILLSAEPDNPYYRKLQSKLLVLQGKNQEAAKIMAPDPDSAPQDPFDYAQYLRLKIKSKSALDALNELQTLVSLPQHRSNPHLLTLIGELLTKLKHHSEAEDSFGKAMQLLPENTYIKQKLGFLYSKMERYDKVIEFLKPLFLKKPSEVILRQTLVRAYEKLDRLTELETVLEQALLHHPEVKQLYGILKRIQNKKEEE